jgi:hypothetical protein
VSKATKGNVGDRVRPLPIRVRSPETQNVSTETNGRLAIELGAGETGGLSQDFSSSGQARRLGISFNECAEPPRVAPLSIPYARTADDAKTLGGAPPSACVVTKSNEVPAGSVRLYAVEATGKNASHRTDGPAVVPAADRASGFGAANVRPCRSARRSSTLMLRSGTGPNSSSSSPSTYPHFLSSPR